VHGYEKDKILHFVYIRSVSLKNSILHIFFAVANIQIRFIPTNCTGIYQYKYESYSNMFWL